MFGMAGTQLLNRRQPLRFDQTHQSLSSLQEGHGSNPRPDVPPFKLNLSDVGGYSETKAQRDSLFSTPRSQTTIEETFTETIEILHQYKEHFKGDGSLTLRSLPPIKVSLKSKSKFMESPRSERNGFSSFIKPGYSQRTYRQGHHVFTEGISDISRTRNPSFALQKIQVPYSNLPDNIQVYKEKDQFAFGVRKDEKDDGHTSPYKLSSKPFGVENASFARTIEVGNSVNDTYTSKRPSHFKGPKKTPKSKVILEPIRKPGHVDNKLLAEFEKGTVQSILNSKVRTKPKKSTSMDRSVDRGDGRLSVVSIGDTVSPDYFNRPKRNARKLYPMYDWRSLQKESYKRSKYGQHRPGSGKTGMSSNTVKSSKLNTTFLQLGNDIDEDTRKKKALHFNRTRSNLTYSDNDPFATDLESSYNNGVKRGFGNKNATQRRQQLRPRSSISNSTTDASQFPVNPPPSEISQYVMDEFAHHVTSDYRAEMLTLVEERERTLTFIIPGDTEHDTNDNAEISDETKTEDENESIEKTPKSAIVDSAHVIEPPQRLGSVPKLVDAEIQDSTSVKEEGPVTDRSDAAQQEAFVPESLRENIDLNIQFSDEKEPPHKDLDSTESEDPDRVDPKQLALDELQSPSPSISQKAERAKASSRLEKGVKSSRTSARLLTLPTVNLETQSKPPIARHTHVDSTSLSRKIQNTPVVVTEARKVKDTPRFEVERENTRDRLKLPVTRMKLYGELNDIPSQQTPDGSPTEELREEQDTISSTQAPLTPRTDDDGGSVKKVVNNTTIAFKSPSETESNAKRQ